MWIFIEILRLVNARVTLSFSTWILRRLRWQSRI